jgi:hypothetical protein
MEVVVEFIEMRQCSPSSSIVGDDAPFPFLFGG